MRKLILAAGVAALAISVPAAAKPDRDGGGKGRQAQVERGGGQKAQRGGNRDQRVERRSGGGQRAFRERRGDDRQAQRMERRGGAERRAQRLERRGGNERRLANFQSNRDERKAQRVERGGGSERRIERIERRGGNERRFASSQDGRNERRARQLENRGDRNFAQDRRRSNERFETRDRSSAPFVADDRRDREIYEARKRNIEQRNRWRDRDEGPRISWRDRDDFRRVDRWRGWDDDDWNRVYANRGIPAAYVGCPPGLAKKSWSCMPPGLARNAFLGAALPTYYASNYLPVGLRDIYYDTDDYYYRWGDGYVYRVDRGDNLISALLPLIGAGYGVGQYFPYYNQPAYYVPNSYNSFYPSYGDDYYRYANGYVYEIDGSTGYIEDVIPLLDRGYGIGQMLPAGYSYYNVPYQYRDYYYDTGDHYYRYAPGAIYQVDAETRLITAIASLLTGGLAVGQPLPASYGVYNVPLTYRDRYHDTSDAWYRYSDGYIYQVDPTTRLITAMVQAIV